MEKEIEKNLKFIIRKNKALKIKSLLGRVFAYGQKPALKKPFNGWGIEIQLCPNEEKIKKSAGEVFKNLGECFVEFLSQSKLGLFSYKVFLKHKTGDFYKCLDFQDEYRAEKVESIIRTFLVNNPKSRLEIPFIARQGDCIFLKWMPGRTVQFSDFLKPDFIEILAKSQASLHSCPLPKEAKKDKKEPEYLDFLAQRLKYFSQKYIGNEGEVQSLVDRVFYQMRPSLNLSITYPDFTDNNLIIACNKKMGIFLGDIYLIDIETLNIDFGYEYDVLNTARFLFPNSKFFQSHYLSLYKKYNSLGTLETHRDFWEAVWLIRLAGSYFQAGEVEKGKKMLSLLKEKAS